MKIYNSRAEKLVDFFIGFSVPILIYYIFLEIAANLSRVVIPVLGSFGQVGWLIILFHVGTILYFWRRRALLSRGILGSFIFIIAVIFLFFFVAPILGIGSWGR